MRIAVVGAGPAGVRVVETLVAAGHRPVWIDEAREGGGRIYQRPPRPLQRDARTLYGFEARKAENVHAAFERLAPLVDWRPETLVWHIRPQARRLSTQHQGHTQATVDYDVAILCTGAMDRVVPLPGWTLPGVTTMGAAQIALKTQGCSIGARVTFVGTGPLLYLVAYQYARAGVMVAAVVDTTPFATKLAAAPGLLRGGATFFKGLYYIGWLRANGVRIVEGAAPVAIDGTTDVQGLRWRGSDGREQQVSCDAVGMGWGLKPEAQLADLAGVPFRFEPLQHSWIPERDAAGRTPVEGHYLAGDGAAIGGADVAELAGARAALALLQDAGKSVDAGRVAALDRALAAQQRFRIALERAFPYPSALAASVADETVLCRCEGLTAGELRAAAREDHEHGPAPEINRAKAFTRVGMGRCQGRVCGPAAAEVLAASLGRDVASIGRLRGQSPVKPMPMSAPETTQ
ncbi:FAD/NAD(P)-binding oxidoreductase [soil metagenome]